MKYYITAIIVLLLLFVLLFQLNTLPKKWQKFSDQLDNDFKGYAMLEDLCLNIGGRIAGTENAKKAENLTINYLKSFGFKDVILQEFEHIGWQRQKCELIIKNSNNDIYTNFDALSLGLTPQKTEIEFELIDLNAGLIEDYQKYSKKYLSNKIALVDKKSPIGNRIFHRFDKVRIAEKLGLRGIILFYELFGNVNSIGTASFSGVSNIPALSITREEGLRLKKLIQSNDTIFAHIKVSNTVKNATSQNISVEIPGNELKNEIVLISAHLDAWEVGQGAVDNGANVAVLLELARQFKLLNLHPKRTIRFMFFGAEEFGLCGSKFFIKDNPNIVDNLFYVLNLEMNISPNGINLLLDDRDKNWFGKLAENLNSLGVQNNIISDPWLESDHAYFMISGIPTLTFSEKSDIFSGQKYHSSGDNIELIDANDLKNCVKVIGIVLQEIANTTEIQKWRLSGKELESKIDKSGLKEIIDLRNMKL